MVDAEQSRSALQAGLELSRLTVQEMVVRCAAIGDHITAEKLAEMLTRSGPRTAFDHDVVASALNEHLTDQGMDQPPVALSGQLGPDTPPPPGPRPPGPPLT